jgi:hypothetical protein
MLVLLGVAVVSLCAMVAAPAADRAPQTIAQATTGPLLSGTPEPTEEPTTAPSDALVAAAAVGPEWSAFAKIAETTDDFIITVEGHEMVDGKSNASTFKLTTRKPHYARCEIVKGDGMGGVAVWRGGDKIQAHEGGEHKDIIVVLPRHNRRVTDLLGHGCGDTSPDMIVGYTTHNGKLSEAPGPTIGGEATDDVTWLVNPGDMVRESKEDFFISKTTHLIVATKGYRGADLVEDSTWKIQVDPGVKFSAFDIGG